MAEEQPIREPSIQREAYRTNDERKDTPLKRSEAKAKAKEMGLDVDGLSTREMRSAIDAKQKADDGMEGFIMKVLDKREKERGNQDPIPAPKIVSTKTETRQSSNLPAPPQTRTRKKGDQSEGIIANYGAFYGMYVKVGGADAGKTYLQGGTVSWGNGGSPESLDDYEVLDADGDPVHADGTVLYVKAECEATVTDGIMLPGCKKSGGGASYTTTSGTDHTFTVTSKTGSLYEEIGRWTSNGFLPSNLGNILASGCIGNFTLSRG